MFNTTTSSASVAAAAVVTEVLRSVTEEDNVPTNYLSDDERLKNLLTYKAAIWIDYIYIPICSGACVLGLGS